MIVSYSVSNFLSILDEVEISFVKGEGNNCMEEVIQNEKVDLLKTIIMFGKNGSGKSNVIISLGYVLKLIMDDPFVIMKKKDVDRMGGPIYYRGNEDKISVFRFTFSFTGFSNIVSYELYYDSSNHIFIKEVIEDEKHDLTIVRDSLGRICTISGNDRLSGDEGLLITTIANNQSIINIPKITKNDLDDNSIRYLSTVTSLLYCAFSNIIVMSFESELVETSNIYPIRLDIVDYLEGILSSITDVEKVVVEKVRNYNSSVQSREKMYFSLNPEPILIDNNDVYRLFFKETGNDSIIPFEQLSTGIQHIIVLILVTSINSELTCLINNVKTRFVVIDEMCYSLHPKLTRYLMDLITFGSTKYPQITQSLYSMHDTNVLSMKRFRNDEFYLVDKDDDSTVVSSIYDYNDVADNIQSMYLDGRFGSVPIVGNYKGIKR